MMELELLSERRVTAASEKWEDVLVVVRHPARGQFRAVLELQLREARRVR